MRHMRLWQRINSTLPLFIEDLLNRLSDGSTTTRDMVLNLDQQLGPATVLSFDSEAAYWGVLTDDEIDAETPRRKRERYVSSSVSEVSDPEYWLKTRYEVVDDESFCPWRRTWKVLDSALAMPSWKLTMRWRR